MKAALIMFLALGCNTNSHADATTDSHNFAIDTVKYNESGANCEAVFTTPTFHSARCTMPDGSKIMCATGPDVKGQGGATTGWACTGMRGVAPPPQPQAQAQPPKPPTPPAPPTPPSPPTNGKP